MPGNSATKSSSLYLMARLRAERLAARHLGCGACGGEDDGAERVRELDGQAVVPMPLEPPWTRKRSPAVSLPI